MNRRTTNRLIIAAAVLGLAAGYSLLKPTLPDFTQFPAGAERKHEFIAYFRPIINQENATVLKERELTRKLAAAAPDLWFYNKLRLNRLLEKYRLEDFNAQEREHWSELLERIDQVPTSLALAQAAKESGWGTSRFAREGNNFFGQWCFTKGCGLVPKNRSAGKTHEVASFSSPADSVRAYIHNLNHNQAYTSLRDLRAKIRKNSEDVSGKQLASGLTKYSERGEKYVQEIKNLIQHNKLESAGS